MRRPLLLLWALALLAACGRGQDPTVAGPGAAVSSTTAPTTASTDPAAVVTTASTTGTTAAAGPSAPAAAAAAPTTAAPGTGEPVVEVPATAFGPPAAGRYRFHTTGTRNGEPVDEHGDAVVESLSASDIRQTTADGSQVIVLRFLADRIELLSLDATLGGQTRHFDGPVLYTPIPPAGTWSWDMRSSDGRTSVHQDSTFAGRETITTPAGTFDTYRVDSTITVVEGSITATVQLQTWVDLGLRTAVRIHQTTNVPLLFQADTTSEYAGFTPA